MASEKDKPNVNLHAGHRKRLMARFEKCGFDSFEEHNILEILLFFSIPRANTNNTAHLLMKEFGSLYNVMTASPKELQKVKGVGPASANLIKAVFDASRRATIQKIASMPIRTYGQIHQIAVEWFAGKPFGTIMALLLDRDDKFLDILEIASEYSMIASTPCEAILPRVRQLKAAKVVYFHNHDEKELYPSDTDLLSTSNLYHDLANENIQLLEHLIVAGFDTIPILDRSLGEKRSSFTFLPE